MEDFTRMTPLTVGSPEQVVERYLTMADHVGDYQRQMFLIDHAGLPLKTVLEQLDLLGEILPELRKGYAEGRPAHIPEAPTHASLVEKARVAGTLTEHRTVGVDDVTGQSPYEAALKGAN